MEGPSDAGDAKYRGDAIPSTSREEQLRNINGAHPRKLMGVPKKVLPRKGTASVARTEVSWGGKDGYAVRQTWTVRKTGGFELPQMCMLVMGGSVSAVERKQEVR